MRTCDLKEALHPRHTEHLTAAVADFVEHVPNDNTFILGILADDLVYHLAEMLCIFGYIQWRFAVIRQNIVRRTRHAAVITHIYMLRAELGELVLCHRNGTVVTEAEHYADLILCTDLQISFDILHESIVLTSPNFIR